MNSDLNKPKNQVRVRFAPSPTGYLHLGGARTALYNWLWARKSNGVFILRIEDTDVERSTKESVQEILGGLTWLGLSWDEGPYLQTDNLPKHVEAAQKLLVSGHAYRCFCTREELEEQRKAAEARKVAFMYDGRCRDLSPEMVDENLRNGMPYVIRFRVPRETSSVVAFEDAVYGRVEKKGQDIEDFVILRSDGRPLYILSNAVDDALDGITHVIRGADGLANTPKQVLIYKALGIDPPIFAHMPLTLDNRKAKLSKRTHGEVVTIAYYREKGFLPWALCNFMALLGWSSGGEQEFFSRDELTEVFDLSKINRSNSIFNYVPGDPRNWTDPKAIHFNATYIRTMPLEELIPFVKHELQEAGLWRGSFENGEKEWFLRTIDLIRARFLTLKDFSFRGRCYFADDFEFDESAVKKNLGKEPRLREFLPELASRMDRLERFEVHSIEEVFRSYSEEKSVKAGILINAARTAVSGTSVGPGLFEMLEVIGKEKVVNRLNKAVELVAS
ncbi:MAG: glutamate--tRNA ligase [Desulfomonile tiedjei]|uniref:Glutamate--tRNA ligase n=1 Tax=Desulfomonile tiedjei TaxID=2358 RepID=A0A9D6V2T8_9BACT|nr:glutamate--tRNA ligase [Desulfomonile tiedjei]